MSEAQVIPDIDSGIPVLLGVDIEGGRHPEGGSVILGRIAQLPMFPSPISCAGIPTCAGEFRLSTMTSGRLCRNSNERVKLSHVVGETPVFAVLSASLFMALTYDFLNCANCVKSPLDGEPPSASMVRSSSSGSSYGGCTGRTRPIRATAVTERSCRVPPHRGDALDSDSGRGLAYLLHNAPGNYAAKVPRVLRDTPSGRPV
jgi:hypothetical protein